MTEKHEKAKKGPVIGPSLAKLISGLGVAGKFMVTQALLNAASDVDVLSHVAQAMFKSEVPNEKWPPDNAEQALWRSRASAAILGVRTYLKGD